MRRSSIPAFAAAVAAACIKDLRDYMTQNKLKPTLGSLTAGIVEDIIRRRLEASIGVAEGKKATPAAPRNELFDALAVATGTKDLRQVTQAERRRIGVALAQIRAASPDLTGAEINRRATAYRRANPTWTLSATALASHWSKFASASGEGRKFDAYNPPPDWRERARAAYPEIELPENYKDLSFTVRIEITRKP